MKTETVKGFKDFIGKEAEKRARIKNIKRSTKTSAFGKSPYIISGNSTT